MLGMNADFFMTFTQSCASEIAIGALERAAWKRHLPFMVPDGISALGQDEMIVAGVVKNGNQDGGLSTRRIRR
jgi:hypothetical protein